MIGFWSVAVIMVALAVAAVLLPLWRYRPRTDQSQNATNTQIYRERLAELDSELELGRIGAGEQQALRTELERTLLWDVPESAPAGDRAGGTLLASVLAVAVPAAALVYYYTGAFRGPTADWLSVQDRLQPVVAEAKRDPSRLPQEALDDLPNFTRVLQAQVLNDGMQDVDSLHALGISLLQLQAPEQAAQMLDRAYRLAPEREELLLAYAQSMIFSNDGKLDTASAGLLHSLLKRQPNHQGALMMLGFGAFNAGDYDVAVTAWEPVLASLDPASEAARLLRESLEKANRQRSQAAAPALQPGADQSAANAANDANAGEDPAVSIAVTVDLAPELRDRLAADATLFIFAKAASGPPMPLAAVRQPADGFPVQVVLDDSKAMVPSHKLSGQQQVVVGARISAIGDVTARPGDLQGISDPLDMNGGSQSVSLTVDTVVQ